MEIYLVIYIVVIMVVMLIDAMTALAMDFRFVFLASLAGAIIWPVSIPLVLFLISKKTKHFPKFTPGE